MTEIIGKLCLSWIMKNKPVGLYIYFRYLISPVPSLFMLYSIC